MIGDMQGCISLHNEVMECCLQGDPWIETLGIRLGVVHLGSMGTKMSDT